MGDNTNAAAIFQFHKGTIKTLYERHDSIHTYRISIP